MSVYATSSFPPDYFTQSRRVSPAELASHADILLARHARLRDEPKGMSAWEATAEPKHFFFLNKLLPNNSIIQLKFLVRIPVIGCMDFSRHHSIALYNFAVAFLGKTKLRRTG